MTHEKIGDVDIQRLGEDLSDRTMKSLGLRTLKRPTVRMKLCGRWETNCIKCGVGIIYLHYDGPGPDLLCCYCEKDDKA